MRFLARLCLIALAAWFLYFHGLDAVGMLGPDEPRYASIGREMAASGDWVTPRLWGEAWFEKPVLLYWMIAAGNLAGLGDDLAPRAPVAAASILFLAAFFRLLREETDGESAFFATLILGSSTGWLAFSHIGVTDLPMASSSALSMLLAFEWLRSGNTRRLPWSGAMLGLAILAKGLVPVALAAPLVWMGRNRRRDMLRIAVPALMVAAPWYGICYARNGAPFFDEFIWKHHVMRFFSSSLEHVQPFWYYIPVILAGMFPWTPLIGILRNAGVGPLQRFLWIWLGFGLVFFSAPVNKLPGYLLPLLPPLAALMGVALRQSKAKLWLVACAALMAFLPVAAAVLPQALETGIRRVQWTAPHPGFLVAAAILCAMVWFTRAEGGALILLAAVTAGVVYFQAAAYPALDAAYSARWRWNQYQAQANEACLDEPTRDLRYGMNYYSRTPLPDCEDEPKPVKIH